MDSNMTKFLTFHGKIVSTGGLSSTTILNEGASEETLPLWLGVVIFIGALVCIVIIFPLALLGTILTYKWIVDCCIRLRYPHTEPEFIQIINNPSDLPENYNLHLNNSGRNRQNHTGPSLNENNIEISTIFRPGTMVSPPNDHPPSYDAVQIDLPTYDEIYLINNNQLNNTESELLSETIC